MKHEKQLWGTKDGAEEWQEQLLLSNATDKQIERVKELAAKDGFGRFHVNKVQIPETLEETSLCERAVHNLLAKSIML